MTKIYKSIDHACEDLNAIVVNLGSYKKQGSKINTCILRSLDEESTTFIEGAGSSWTTDISEEGYNSLNKTLC